MAKSRSPPAPGSGSGTSSSGSGSSSSSGSGSYSSSSSGTSSGSAPRFALSEAGRLAFSRTIQSPALVQLTLACVTAETRHQHMDLASYRLDRSLVLQAAHIRRLLARWTRFSDGIGGLAVKCCQDKDEFPWRVQHELAATGKGGGRKWRQGQQGALEAALGRRSCRWQGRPKSPKIGRKTLLCSEGGGCCKAGG